MPPATSHSISSCLDRLFAPSEAGTPVPRPRRAQDAVVLQKLGGLAMKGGRYCKVALSLMNHADITAISRAAVAMQYLDFSQNARSQRKSLAASIALSGTMLRRKRLRSPRIYA